MRDDMLTIAAIAVIAACIATAAHEAAGHGGACLVLGGKIVQLTSVYFDCSRHNVWIPASGPLGNLAAAVASWLGLRWLPIGRPRARLLLVLTMAFSLFWAAGYLLYSAVTGGGDNAIVARILFGPPDWAWRAGLFVLGLALYRVGMPLVARSARPFSNPPARARALLLTGFAAGGIVEVFAAAFYAPDRGGAMIQGALEIAGASIPLVLLALRAIPAASQQEPVMARSFAWIAAAGILLVGFAATLGRGLP